MKVKNSFLLLLLLFILLLSFTVSAKQVVEENQIRITSEDNYFCEPIIRGDYCLIRADFLIENTGGGNKNIYVDTSFTDSFVDVEGYKDKKTKEKYDVEGTKTKDKLKIDGYQSLSLTVEFWALIDGKFNITVDSSGTLTVLDPLYNVSFSPQHPSYYLEGGDVMAYNHTQFDNYTLIDGELSDGNPLTSFLTSSSGSPVDPSLLIEGWFFNEHPFYSNLQSFRGYHNGIILGCLDSVVVDDYFGGYFDGTNDFVSILHNNDLNPQSDNFSFGVKINVSSLASSGTILSKIGVADGYSMTMQQNGLVNCIFDGSSGTSSTVSSTSIKDNQQHIIVCVKEDNSHYMWVDGILEDTEVTDTGGISNFKNLYFGTNYNFGNKLTGTISQIGIVRSALQNSTIQYFECNKSIGDRSKGSAVDVFFNHTFNIDEHKYLLYLISDLHFNTFGSIRVMNNYNATVLPQEYVSQTITSEEAYIDITSIVNNGSNYPFRIWSLLGQNLAIEDIYLVETIEDNESPIINNCFANTTYLGCDEKARLQCNITDNQAIFKAYFTIFYNDSDGSNFTVIQEAIKTPNSTIWYYDIQSVQTNATRLIHWLFTNATDLVGNHNYTQPNIVINHTCICVENWTSQYTNYSCLINDTFLSFKWYEDQNECGTFDNFPLDNATYSYANCDYCTPIPTNTSCIRNDTSGYIVEYDYLNCYYLTNLSSDIFTNITYPCYPLLNELDVPYYTAFPELSRGDDTISWLVKIPSEHYVGNEFSCLSYVKKNNQTIQTNPSIKSTSFRGKEDRTSFRTVNAQTTVYFTGENVKIDKMIEYIFGVKCSDGNTTLTSEYYVIPQLKNLDFVSSAYLWSMSNSTAIILIAIVIFIILSLWFWIWRTSK